MKGYGVYYNFKNFEEVKVSVSGGTRKAKKKLWI